MKIYHAQVNHLENPMGFRMERTVFSWKVKDAEGKKQSYARIRVASDAAMENLLFDSGEDDKASSLFYPVKLDLEPRTRYYWNVEAGSDAGETAVSEVQFFETGKRNEAWTGKWISCDSKENRHPYFEKEIVPAKEVAKARLYVCGLGLYEVYVDEKRVGDEYLTPYSNDYNEWVQYQTYDVTEEVSKQGMLRVLLGNGWYKGIFGFTCEPNRYGTQAGAFLELHVEYEDGSKDVIATDETWSVKTGEIRYSEIYMGETIDTDAPEITEGNVVVKEFDKAVLTAQENEPVRITEKIEGKKLIVTPKGERLVDFGQIVTGVVEVHVKGEKGQKIVIRHAEVLDKDGNFYPETLRQAKSIDTFICNGEEQIFRPHFTFHGFRYICVEGMDEFTADQFIACVTHSDMEKTGDFNCSNKKVNQLQSNITWSQRDNFLDIPTDCPQRDERLGWTGDAEIFCRTACFLENTYSFYRKWLRDVEADQTEEGGVAHVVPDIISGNEGYNWLLEQGSHSAAERRFEIPGNTVEFVRDLRYNKYRVFTELQNEQKKKGCGRMIDIAHAKQEFEKYLDEYDREDEQICLKIVHTYGVVKYAGEIARKMECSGEDVELAELIGLLHDIGRFEQIRRFHSFEPGTMDHAVFGAELLFGEEKLIRRFVEDDKFDELIDAAIRKHSDFKLEGIHDARTLFHAKLIRDADKLDNCRVKLEASVEAMLGVSEKAAGEGLISPAVWESCLRRESVLSADRHVPVDYWVSYLAQYYDINFPETCEIIEEEDYITRIAGRLTYQEQDTRTKLHILTEDLNRYLEMPAVSVKE